MTLRETFTLLRNDLSKFNQNEPIVVSYNVTRHELTFHQLNLTVQVPYIGLFFLPKKKFKVGVLSQLGYNKLCRQLDELLANNLIDDFVYLPRAEILGTSFYRILKDRNLAVPSKVFHLDYVNVKSSILCWYLCTRYSEKTKLTYKLIKNEKDPNTSSSSR
jgi:hypothetical protein